MSQEIQVVQDSISGLEDRPGSELTLLFNRELSWLEFNQRVLSEAENTDVPLLERLKFIGIFANNLDEFFMKRVGRLRLQLEEKPEGRSPDGLTPAEQLVAVQAKLRPLYERQYAALLKGVWPGLRHHGVDLLRYAELSPAEHTHLRDFFEAQVFPILTPLGLDVSHPFPFISNLSLSLAVAVQAEGAAARFARVKVPASLPRWVALPRPWRFVALEDVIAANLPRLFPGLRVVESYPFRVTRAAIGERNEEIAADLLESVQEDLRARRFAEVVRLEVPPEMPAWMRELLLEELSVDKESLYEVRSPLAARDLMQWAQLPLLELRDKPWRSIAPPRFNPINGDGDVFKAIQKGDILVHHPYDSFTHSVQRFLQAAAEDPAVLAIKQTLYRTSRNSAVVKSLIQAAERGKQVAVLVELQASFDEARNIEWAEALEAAGAHVAYGVLGYKTHAKVSLVVRNEPEGLRSYTHVATGNYNADTAELYTDLGLFTCNPEIGADAAELFNLLTSGHIGARSFKRLLVAPVNLRGNTLEKIERERRNQLAGKPARIIVKMNALDDPEIIRALYEASAVGVETRMIVRGLCCLRPGIKGYSASIGVRSLVGRFLEHARIFHFENAGHPEYWIGSADWMARNLDGRVEALVPIDAPELQAELRAILDEQWADNINAWELAADGSYHKRAPAAGEEARASQLRAMEQAVRVNRSSGS